jgi:hypothetical protein
MDNHPTPRPFSCGQCGLEHTDCLAHNKAGDPCGKRAINGADVCPDHGARAPQVAAAAERRVELGRAERAVVTYGLPRNIDPFDALREEIARTAGHVAWLAEIVSELEQDVLVWGKTLEEAGKGTGQKEGNTAKIRNEASVNIWLTLYDQERKHLVLVCRTAIQCGLAKREVEILESQGRLIADMFRSIFDDPELGLDDGTKRRMREIASRHLRAA